MLTWLAKIGVSALLLSLLIGLVGWDRIADSLRAIDPSWLFVFYSCCVATRTIDALQLSRLFRSVDVDLRPRRIFLANSLALLYSLVTPGEVVASAVKWSDLSAASGNRAVVLNAMIYNRLILLLMPLLIGSLAFFWENPFADSRLQVAISLTTLVVAGLAFSIFSPQTGPRLESLINSAASRLPEGARRKIDTLMVSLRPFRGMCFRHHTIMLGFAGLSSLSAAGCTYVACLAVGVEIPLAVVLWTQPVLFVARQVPITISNLGVREGLLIYVFGLYGVAAERAFGVGILAFSGVVLIAVVGLVYQVALLLGFARWTAEDG